MTGPNFTPFILPRHAAKINIGRWSQRVDVGGVGGAASETVASDRLAGVVLACLVTS